MSDQRLGIVPLVLADGRTVDLRFTWRALDTIGAAGVVDMINKATSGDPGDMSALAILVSTASGGAVTADELMDGGAPKFEDAMWAVAKAYKLATRRPADEEAGEAAANPLKRLWTSLSGLWGRIWRQG